MHLLKKTIEKTEDLNKNTGLTILAHALNDSFLINLYNNRLVTSGKPVLQCNALYPSCVGINKS
jgi:hypothetical protein